MEKEKEEGWCFIVKTDGLGYLDKNPSYFRNKDREVAYTRAKGFIKITIDRYCTEYKMGKDIKGIHKIAFTLFSSELINDGKAQPEEILEHHRVSEYLGNISL